MDMRMEVVMEDVVWVERFMASIRNVRLSYVKWYTPRSI
jgi:hypothetical protein